jgi:nicotinamidase-related amidase
LNTCIEATARLGMELGYHVTLIKDAIAALSHEGMHAALEVKKTVIYTCYFDHQGAAGPVASRIGMKITNRGVK